MPCLSTMLHRASRHALPIIVLGLTLTACGGGDDKTPATGTATPESNGGSTTPDTVGPETTLPVSTEPCPTDYRKITISDSSILGNTLPVSAGNGTFTLTFPKVNAVTSLQACLGLPAGKLTQAGYQTLSDTYEVKVTTASAAVAAQTALVDLKPKLTIKFALTGLPQGLSAAALADKINVYTLDYKGVWQVLATPVINIKTEPVGEAVSTIDVTPTVSGKFVVAYKP